MVQTNTPNSFQDPLRGIDGPITRGRIKRMKDALQCLIMEVYDKEAILKSSKIVLEVSKASPKIIIYLYVQEEE